MDKASVSTGRKLLGWLVLMSCLVFAAKYIQGAFWVSSQEVTISNWYQVKFGAYAVSLIVAGIAIFSVIRAFPKVGRVNIGLLVLAFVFVLAPNAWEFMKSDACLDAGGAWNYVEFKCEK